MARQYDTDTLERLRTDAQDVLSRYPETRSALLPLLHLVQSVDGYVSPQGIAFCAETLDISQANVSAVATFYSQYKRKPNGEYTVGVCTNTLCAVMGGDAIYQRISERLGLHHDETTGDGKITLEQIECNAACDYAPVMMINWEFFDNQTPSSALEVIDRLLAGEPVTPTRGPDHVATFKEVSRTLAGFEDGLVNQGPTAGEASLAGLKLAREHGWSAPPLGSHDGEHDSPTGDAHVGEPGSSADRPAPSSADVHADTEKAKEEG